MYFSAQEIKALKDIIGAKHEMTQEQCSCNLTYLEQGIRENAIQASINEFQISGNKARIDDNDKEIDGNRAKIEANEHLINDNGNDIDVSSRFEI